MDKYVCPCGYVYDPELGDPDNRKGKHTYPYSCPPKKIYCVNDSK